MLKTVFRFMTFDKPKSFGALLGVVLSIFLIGQQSGIFIFLTGAMSALVDNTRTDLWVVDEYTTNVNAMGLLDARVGRELESIAGVRKAYPMIVAGSSARFAGGKTFGVLLVGAQAPEFRGGPWRVSGGTVTNLVNDGAISFDYFDRKNFGNPKLGDYFELGGKKVHLGVETRGARGFGAVYMFTTLERARALGRVSTGKVSAFLVETEPGVDKKQVRDRINAVIFGVKAWTPPDFSAVTVKTILGSSGIAISVGTLIVFAIISGFVIIGLTLFSAAVDRIKDYGTMKAIGATNGYVSRLIYIQAIIIAFVGYGIGMLLLEGFRNGIAQAGTLFNYPIWLRLAFLGLTIFISLGGSFFAVRRITRVEPASVFR